MARAHAATADRASHLDPAVVADIVRRSRLEQGLPPQVESPAVLAKLAVLVGAVLVEL